MTYDKNRFTEASKKIEDDRRQRTQGHLLSLVHAAPPFEKLTGLPEWDKFLEVIQGMIKQSEGSRDALKVQLESSSIVNYEQIMTIKINLAVLNDRLSTLNGVIDLPKTIVEKAKQADSLL